MGTMLQSSDVTVDDFQGLEGCNEILNITVPTSCPDSTTLTGTMLMGSETGVTLTVNPLASTPSITTPMVAAGTVSVTPPARTSKIAPRW
ncbi:hypothetical protein HMPREF9344_02410 [Cutibacterium acnes HL097PA1]|nr:hypothetical protein HMPREF9344_02410 [Cutibacterium acnes HL097PA1]